MSKTKIAIIGLGYVGLPLAVEFGKRFPTIGFDIKEERIRQLKEGVDTTQEVSQEQFTQARFLSFSSEIESIRDGNHFIVTVPTPIDRHKKPDLSHVIKASERVGSVLKKGDLVIYESTVYPGCTEEVCVPILERTSGLSFNQDFFCGYSPERINPGDKQHSLTEIKKVTAGSTPEVAQQVDALYQSIITAGTHLVSSIKVAEAAKVIENAQRDLNIAFVNELAIIFNHMNLDTHEVLAAAGTKWNFLPFKPGLVGGHCIGVDPYYLTYKAQELGYHPEIILAGRRLNDMMGHFVANQMIKLLIQNGHKINGCKVLILGITFKENCPDIRNSRVIDIIHELSEFGCQVHVHDPWASAGEVAQEYQLCLSESIQLSQFSGVVLAVAHRQFLELDFSEFKNANGIVYDLKGVLNPQWVNKRL